MLTLIRTPTTANRHCSNGRCDALIGADDAIIDKIAWPTPFHRHGIRPLGRLFAHTTMSRIPCLALSLLRDAIHAYLPFPCSDCPRKPTAVPAIISLLRHAPHLFLVVGSCFLMACSTTPNSRTPGANYDTLARDTLVPVHFTLKSKAGGFGGEWIGFLPLATWDQLKNGNYESSRLIIFTRCYFIDDKGAVVRASDTKGPTGNPYGYSDQMVVSTDAIFRLIPGFTVDFNGTQLKVEYHRGIVDPTAP